MAGRSGPRSHEGYPSTSPSADPHDPFGNANAAHRYYDNESDNADNYNPRDTYASGDSNQGYPEPERYYDQNGPYDAYGSSLSLRFLQCLFNARFLGHPDTDSEGGAYGQRYTPSSESLAAPRTALESSTPTILDYGGSREQYPAWTPDRQIPLSKEEIEDIFLDLTQKFGFQRESMRNMVCAFHDDVCRFSCFPVRLYYATPGLEGIPNVAQSSTPHTPR